MWPNLLRGITWIAEKKGKVKLALYVGLLGFKWVLLSLCAFIIECPLCAVMID